MQSWVFFPKAFAEFQEEGIRILNKDARCPVSCSFIVVNYLSFEYLVIVVSWLLILVVSSHHFLLIDLKKLRPLKTVVQIQAIHSEFLDYS